MQRVNGCNYSCATQFCACGDVTVNSEHWLSCDLLVASQCMQIMNEMFGLIEYTEYDEFPRYLWVRTVFWWEKRLAAAVDQSFFSERFFPVNLWRPKQISYLSLSTSVAHALHAVHSLSSSFESRDRQRNKRITKHNMIFFKSVVCLLSWDEWYAPQTLLSFVCVFIFFWFTKYTNPLLFAFCFCRCILPALRTDQSVPLTIGVFGRK